MLCTPYPQLTNISALFYQVCQNAGQYIMVQLNKILTMPPVTDNKKLWESVLSEMELNVSKANFSTWFKDTHVIRQDSGTVYVGVPNTFVRDWLVTKYHKLILKSLRNLADHIRAVEYHIASEHRQTTKESSTSSTMQTLLQCPILI